MTIVLRFICAFMGLFLFVPAPVDEISEFDPFFHLRASVGALFFLAFMLLRRGKKQGRVIEAFTASITYFIAATALRLIVYLWLNGFFA
jgi:hypothetical protein